PDFGLSACYIERSDNMLKIPLSVTNEIIIYIICPTVDVVNNRIWFFGNKTKIYPLVLLGWVSLFSRWHPRRATRDKRSFLQHKLGSFHIIDIRLRLFPPSLVSIEMRTKRTHCHTGLHGRMRMMGIGMIDQSIDSIREHPIAHG